jgi:hypothetical protein
MATSCEIPRFVPRHSHIILGSSRMPMSRFFRSLGEARPADARRSGPRRAKRKTSGLLIHAAVAVDAKGEVRLGLIGTWIWARRGAEKPGL